MFRINDMVSNNISLEPPAPATSGEASYLTPLWVSVIPDELSHSAATDGFELELGNIDQNNLKFREKIIAALKKLAFRETHVLVQFWSSRVSGKRTILATRNQPFGFGVNDESLLLYRKESEYDSFVVDNDDEEEGIDPIARVFMRELPEWTTDVTNYLPKQFLRQACAIRCNLHGYMALPVFDSTQQLCVGVMEILRSSKYVSFAYEVQQIFAALKTQNLTCPQALVYDDPTSNVHREPRLDELEKLFSIMKVLCDTHDLPLAQTWAISPLCTSASHEQTLTKSCNSFNSRCLGKVCMSTTSLPYYVRDLGLWHFREACNGIHLDTSRGLVGRALQSHGSAFCADVTKLSKEEYPLVHIAYMSCLTSCLAIFLHNVETNHDFVLEFFLQSHLKYGAQVLNLVQMLKHNIEISSGFALGVSIEPDVIETSSCTVDTLTDVEDAYVMDTLTDVEDTAETDSVNVPHNYSYTCSSITITNAGEWSSPLNKGTKPQRGSKGTKRQRGSKVTITYGEDIIRFRFHIPLGLLELKKLVAERFKLEKQRIRLKYWDEDDDLIIMCSNDDLHFACSNNNINLICEYS